MIQVPSRPKPPASGSMIEEMERDELVILASEWILGNTDNMELYAETLTEFGTSPTVFNSICEHMQAILQLCYNSRKSTFKPSEMQSIILQIQAHLAQGHKYLALNKEDLSEFLKTTLVDVDIDFKTVKLIPGHQIPRGQVCAVTSNEDRQEED